MAASAFAAQAADIRLPQSTTSDTFAASGVNTGGLDLTPFAHSMIWLKSTQDCRVRVGSTLSAASAGDIYLNANVDYTFRVTKSDRFLSVLGMGDAGTVYVAKTG